MQTPARIGTGFDILGSSHRACTTTLHKLAKFCTSLEMLANPCKSLQSIAKPCTTLHVSVLVLTYWAALRQFIGLIARQAAPYAYHCTFCTITTLGFNFAAKKYCLFFFLLQQLLVYIYEPSLVILCNIY